MRFLASASLLAALASASPALANSFGFGIGFTPSVHVSVSGSESQAALASQLKSEGYDDIQLSAYLPNMDNPQPQFSNPTTDLAQTPAHQGWNGTAYKNGKLYNVYVGE